MKRPNVLPSIWIVAIFVHLYACELYKEEKGAKEIKKKVEICSCQNKKDSEN